MNPNFNFNNYDLKQYDKFKNILINFQKLYGIEEYNLKYLYILMAIRKR